MREERDRRKPPATETKDKDKRIDRIYLCPTKSFQNFHIQVVDENGKKVPKTDNRGAPVYIGNKQIFLEINCLFEPVSAKDEKVMCVYNLLAGDDRYDDKFAILESMKNDPSSWVMDKEMYEQYKNPDAAAAKSELRRIRDENSEKDNIISRIEEENAKLKALLDERTNPSRK